MSFGRRPWSQPKSQKLVFLPSPSTTVVQAANKSLSSSSHGASVPTQGLPGETQWCQSHLSRSALANFSKSGMPSPPLSFGKQVRVQFTLHFPPDSCLSPAQRKRLRSLSRSTRMSLQGRSAERKYTGWEDNTDFVRVSLPACVRLRPDHADSFPFAESMRG
jgi:hypothetical protein